MSKYHYMKIDAFTEGKSLGNPAACLYLNENEKLTDEQMLQIAKEHKNYVSEVVFCKPEKDVFNLCYYSSECEVNFCGHGTIACMYSYIKNHKELWDKKEIKLHTRREGDLILYNEIKEKDVVYISAPKPRYLNVSVSKERIADILGISQSDLANYPLELIDVGNKTLIVPINSLEKEVSIYPNEEKLKKFTFDNGIDIILIYYMKPKKHFAHTRVFAAKYGYLEDPATGSGNSAFGYYMLKNKMWDGKDISLEQGGNNRIYNTVFLRIQDGNLQFGEVLQSRLKDIIFVNNLQDMFV